VTNTSIAGSYYTMTLKFASLEWKPNEHFKVQAGGILQNHSITQEQFWGYRYVAPTFQDKFRVGGEYNYRINHQNISNHDLFGWSFYRSYAV